jgi:5'-deoxynucleotidase YfbR-like HD superfamily hydrolase
MISPFKAALGLDYRKFEDSLLHAVYLRFSLPAELSQSDARAIKRADKASAFLEATQLAGFEDREAARFFGRPRGLAGAAAAKFFDLEPWPAAEAQARFLKRFEDLQV